MLYYSTNQCVVIKLIVTNLRSLLLQQQKNIDEKTSIKLNVFKTVLISKTRIKHKTDGTVL